MYIYLFMFLITVLGNVCKQTQSSCHLGYKLPLSMYIVVISYKWLGHPATFLACCLFATAIWIADEQCQEQSPINSQIWHDLMGGLEWCWKWLVFWIGGHVTPPLAYSMWLLTAGSLAHAFAVLKCRKGMGK